MGFTFTLDEVSLILTALDVAVDKYEYDLDGGWIDDEDDAKEMRKTSKKMLKLWNTTYAKYLKSCKEKYEREHNAE